MGPSDYGLLITGPCNSSEPRQRVTATECHHKATEQHDVVRCAVVGCAMPAGPVGGWVKMDGHSRLIVGCNATAGVWRLTCVDGQWAGAIGNCTSQANTGTITHSIYSPLSPRLQAAVCLILIASQDTEKNRSLDVKKTFKKNKKRQET